MTINLSKIKNKEKTDKSEESEELENKKEKKEETVKNNKSLMEKINNFLLKFSRVSLKDKLFFVQYLGIMLRAGISLSIALKTLAIQTENKKFSKVINDMSESVEKGVSLTESLRPHVKVFGELFVNMVEAGELSGKLEDVLNQLYVQLKKNHELISKVKGALTYPVVIVFAMVGIGIFMMIFIVPKLTSMLLEFGSELPLPTKILIAVSDALMNNGLLSLVGFILFVLIFIKTLKTYKGKFFFQTILLKMPIISPIIKKINLARFSRTVSSLLKTDIMIIKTFEISANVLGNLHYREAILVMSEKIKKGSQINEVISLYPKLFPPIVEQIVSVGEQTGELDSILTELADFYEGEVNKIMDNLPSIIEPILILALGLGVGGMAVAIIMPMYSMSAAI
jgi:type IV pilus assembly protein PilC